MNMKYTKQIATFMAFVIVLGGMTLFTPSAKANPVIMSAGLYPYQVYPGYSGPIIMGSGTYTEPGPAPVIPDLYAYVPEPTYTYPTNPVVNQGPIIMSPGIPQVTYTQPTVVYTQPTTVVTQPTTTQTTTVVKGTTIHAPVVNGIKTNSNTIGINASSNVPGICTADTVNYTLNYANTTTGTITNAMLIVTMPAEIDYKSSTAATNYNERNRTVTLFIGTLTKGQSGIVYLQGTANRLVNGTTTVTTRVDFTFIKANGATDTTTNYVIHSGTNCANALGASVLGSGFLPTSFGAWVLIVVLLCAIIFIVRKFFGKQEGHAHGGHMEHQAH